MEFLKVSGATADGIIITTNLNRDSKLKATQDHQGLHRNGQTCPRYGSGIHL